MKKFNNTGIPTVVLHNMVNNGQIPTVKVKWMDERVCCGRARSNDPRLGVGCMSLAQDSDGTTWCLLNAPGATPCIFDEPESASIWGRVDEQRKIDTELAMESSRANHHNRP